MYCGKRLRPWADYIENENNIFISDRITLGMEHSLHQLMAGIKVKRLQSAKGNAITVVDNENMYQGEERIKIQ